MLLLNIILKATNRSGYG